MDGRVQYPNTDVDLKSLDDLTGLAALFDWTHCELTEFNIGYDCGDEPWAFNPGLSSAVLGRLSAAAPSLRLTLYLDRSEVAEQSHALEPAAGPGSSGESSPPAQ